MKSESGEPGTDTLIQFPNQKISSRHGLQCSLIMEGVLHHRKVIIVHKWSVRDHTKDSALIDESAEIKSLNSDKDSMKSSHGPPMPQMHLPEAAN